MASSADDRPEASGGGAPHGGVVVDRVLVGESRRAVQARAKALNRLVLNPVAISDLECLATGVFSPLTGSFEHSAGWRYDEGREVFVAHCGTPAREILRRVEYLPPALMRPERQPLRYGR